MHEHARQMKVEEEKVTHRNQVRRYFLFISKKLKVTCTTNFKLFIPLIPCLCPVDGL